MKISFTIILVTFILINLPAKGFSDAFDEKAREGITYYNHEKFDEATEKFQESQLNQPDNPEVAYNLGNSQYRLGHYKEAVESYKKVVTENAPPELKQKSYYNMGNAYYRIGYMDLAVGSYKKALELNSGDMDAKFNLELAQKKLDEAIKAGRVEHRGEKSPPPSDQPNNPSSTKDEPEKQPESHPEESDDIQSAKKPSQVQPNTPDNLPPSPQSTEQEKTEKSKSAEEDTQQTVQLSPEEAEQWLGILTEDLKKISRRQLQGKMKDMFVDHDKNW